MSGSSHSHDEIGNAENNWEPFIGNGQRCLPGESDNCGDGGKAKDARLSYPKGRIKSITCHFLLLLTIFICICCTSPHQLTISN